MKNQATYINGLTRKEQAEVIQDIITRNNIVFPQSVEMYRLGPVFCDENRYKAYSKMSIEQFESAARYFQHVTSHLSPEEISDDNNEDVNTLFEEAESSYNNIGNFEHAFHKVELIETPFVISFRNWLETNNINVELNAGMCHWMTCAIEAYMSN